MKLTDTEGFTPIHILSGLEPQAAVLVAFSGGADSSVLLRLVNEYAKRHGAEVYAAHLNHMIRGGEAERDEQFCRKVCESLGIKLFVRRQDIPALAREQGKSIETAARDARYAFFDGLMREHSIPILATAHNANDNLETQLFNIIRGCGLRGVCGIPVSRKCAEGVVVRPILGMSREQILGICRACDIEYVTDSTNTDTDYTRNKIRATVIPALTEINPAAIKNSARLSESLRADALCLDSMADLFCESMNDDASFDTKMLTGSPSAVSSRALMSLYADVSGGGVLEKVHLDAILALCKADIPHSRINLPLEVDATIENGALYLKRRKTPPAPPSGFCVELCEGKNTICEINAEIVMGNSQSVKNIYKTSIPMYLDFDKINGKLGARERRPSDKISYKGVHKSVKKLLSELHIPLEVRYRLPMICMGEEIVAIPHVGVADGFRTKNRENALTLTFNLF